MVNPFVGALYGFSGEAPPVAPPPPLGRYEDAGYDPYFEALGGRPVEGELNIDPSKYNAVLALSKQRNLETRSRLGLAPETNIFGRLGRLTYNPGDPGSSSAAMADILAGGAGSIPEGGLSLLDDRPLRDFGANAERTVDAPFLYAQLLLEAHRAGGTLAELDTQASYRNEVRSILDQERRSRERGASALSQRGYSSSSAQRAFGEDPYRAQRALAGMTAQRQAELAENRFAGEQALLASLDEAETKQIELSEARRALREARRARRRGEALQVGAAIVGEFNTGPFAPGG